MKKSKKVDKRNEKKGSSITADLLNFQYDRPAVPPVFVSSSSSSHNSNYSRNSHNSNNASRWRTHELSSIQAMQASFKFIVDPFIDPHHECLYNADVLIPWEHVIAVIVDISNEHSLSCPICLSDTRLPKISKCGHTFCCSCILRHMSNSSNGGKCPMCANTIQGPDPKSKSLLGPDFKSVLFRTANLPKVKDVYTFQLLNLPTGMTLSPKTSLSSSSMYSSKDNSNGKAMVTVNDIIPFYSSRDASYCRISVMSFDGLDSLLQSEKIDILTYRDECLKAGGMTDEPIEDNTLNPTSNVAVGNVWQQRAAANKAATMPKSTAQSSAKQVFDMDSNSNADVEYLPYIRIAEDDLNQRMQVYTEKRKKLSSALVSRLQSVSEDGIMESIPVLSSEYSVFYQCIDGDLYFLHPMCMKAVLAEHAQHSSPLPVTIRGEVLSIDQVKVTSNLRQRIPGIRPLPEGSLIGLVEVDLKDIVSESVRENMAPEVENRRRQRKEAELRDRRLDERIKRQEYELIHERKLQCMLLEQQRQMMIDDLLAKPNIQDIPIDMIDTNEVISLGTSPPPPVPPTYQSFSKVTQMGGSFPTLGETVTKNIQRNVNNNSSSSNNNRHETMRQQQTKVWGWSASSDLVESASVSTSVAPTPSKHLVKESNPKPSKPPVSSSLSSIMKLQAEYSNASRSKPSVAAHTNEHTNIQRSPTNRQNKKGQHM